MGWRKKVVGAAKSGVTGFVEVAVPGGKIATKGLEHLPRGKKLIEDLGEEKKLSDKERLDNLSTVVATLVGVCEEHKDEIDGLKKALGISPEDAAPDMTQFRWPGQEDTGDRVIQGVPFVYQADKGWAEEHIVPHWVDKDGRVNVRTYQTYGCTLACICSIANYYRAGMDITPLGLAAYLRKNDGFLTLEGHQTATVIWGGRHCVPEGTHGP